MPVCGIVYNNRRGLQLGQLIEQGSSSRGPGAGFQLGGSFSRHLQRKGGHRLAGAAVIGHNKRDGGWGGQRE